MQLFHLTKSEVNQISKTVQWFENCLKQRHAGTWLSRLPWTKMKKIEQVRGLSVPNPYHCATDASSLDGDIWSTLHPPAWKRKSWTITKPLKYRREVLHLYRWSTHTQTCIHTYIHTHIYTYIHTYKTTHTNIHTYIHYIHYTHYTHYTHTYIHTYILTYLHTYIQTYIHYIHTDSTCIQYITYIY